MTKSYNSQEALETAKNFFIRIKEAHNRYQELYALVGKCDRETTDIVHDIELNDFTAKEGNLKARALRRVRRERRVAKDEMEYVAAFKRVKEKYKNLEQDLETLYNTLVDIKARHEKRIYTPRESQVIVEENE